MAAEPWPGGAAALDHAGRRIWLIHTLRGLSPDFAGEITDDTALAEGGLGLDSLGLIELVSAMEEHLGVTVRESELTDDHFGSVARVLGLLEARLG